MLKKHKLHDFRKSYEKGVLNKGDLRENPINQFNIWFAIAHEVEGLEANAMTLATVNPDGQPSARIVLLKEVNDSGFVFFTNYNSRKGQELTINHSAAVLFYWSNLQQQVRIEGKVTKIPKEDSTAYFQSRPKGSQMGAIASAQSQIIEEREVLEKRIVELSEIYKDQDKLPRPENWGGYLLEPTYFEFWQGRENRLHDRFSYALTTENNTWKIDRLSP